LPDLVANLAHLTEFFFFGAGDRRRIGEAPVQSFCRAGKDGTFLSAGFIANGDDVSEKLPRLEDIKDGLGFLLRDVDAGFLHDLDSQRIKRARFKARALGFEMFAANLIEPCFGHLAARAVVHANEENFLFHCDRTLDTARAR
jgi:hypothetical protein